jgi:hydrophobe/amphiphile efflux-1 (HAE1) family protein
MQALAELCVRRPVFATVLSLLIMVVGGVFYKQLGVDQFPKVDLPFVIVTTRLPGASPEDVETEISDKIEAAVNTLSGIDELRSFSSEGVSQVGLTFVIEKNADVAAQEVRDKVQSILADLPKGIDPPVVSKVDPDAQPVLYLALRGPAESPRELTEFADRVVRRRLENLSGVGEVSVLGGRKRQINVLLDPARLRGFGLTALDVSRAIDAQNLTVPGGRVDASRDLFTLRVYGRVKTLDELRRIVLRESGGSAIRLEDVGTVEDGEQDVETSALWNGERTVVLSIRKQSGTNTVEVVDGVLERLADVRTILPNDYQLDVLRDASGTIRTSTEAVTEHLVVGALFASLIVLMFLGNLRSTVIAAVAIPTSIVGTFALMYLRGYTLNTITLLALALAVGIVIDDAIVVLENIFRFVEEKGMSPLKAAVEGTREIGPAVMATTLSLIAVFLPIAFLAGIPGRFLASFGITMSFAIAVSLFISFTLTPMLASQWLRAKAPGEPHKGGLERLVDFFYRPIERAYMRMLRFAMRHRWLIVALSLGSLATLGPLAQRARKGFLPVDDKAQFEVTVRLPEGRSVPATELVTERIARDIRALPHVEATLVTVGDDGARTPNLGRIYVRLVDPAHRPLTQDQMKALVRERILAPLPSELRTSVADVNEFGGNQSTARVQYILSGPDLQRLEASANRVVEKLRRTPGAVDVDSSLITGKPEVGVYIDRERAADLGVEVADIARSLAILVGGQKVGTFAEGGEQYDIRVRAGDEFRADEASLSLLTVPSRKLGQVALADVVKLERGTGPSTINRFARERQVTILANAAPGVSEGAIADAVVKAIAEENLPRTFHAMPSGQTKFMKQTAVSFGLGLLASMVFMYLILAAQFESWLHPVTILLSLPLTLPFALLSVLVFDLALDIYSFLGIFVLFGVVKKNAILQIDHTNHLRGEGLDRLAAILQANKDRLRPILMTTFAFVAGMLPLVMSRGIGAGFNRATAGVVVGGQLLSLVLTLLAVPVAYSLFDDAGQGLRRLAAWVGQRFARGRSEAGPGLELGPPPDQGDSLHGAA